MGGTVTEPLRIRVLGADQQVIALSTATSPLVLLSPGPDVRVLGAIDPAKYPDITVEMYQNPRCHYRIEVAHGGKKFAVHGLTRALASLESYAKIEGEVPAEPWKLVSI